MAGNTDQGRGDVRAGAGRAQARKIKHGRVRQPNLSRIYSQRARGLDLTKQRFRTTAIRPPYAALELDGVIEQLDWTYDPGDPTLHGTVSLRAPRPERQRVSLNDGHQIKLECLWAGSWRTVWVMRLYNGAIDPVSGAWTFDLHDDLYLLQSSLDNWHYSRSKKHGHPKGWRCDEILVDVARRYRIPLGKVAQGRHAISALSMQDASPLQIIQRAYAIEKNNTGRRFTIAWRDGKLHVIPLERNPLLYVMHAQITEALLGHKERGALFATAGTVRATVKSGKKHHKLVETYVNERAARRLGFVHKLISGSGVDSSKEARDKIKRYIARHSSEKRQAEVSHYGIAFVRRGDALELDLASYGYSGNNGFAFVQSGSWLLSRGSFTMTLQLGFDDPIAAARAAKAKKDKDTRKKKRNKRNGH